MKSAEVKTASPALQRKADKPFFGKGNESFFGIKQITKPDSFFTNHGGSFSTSPANTIQAKLTVGRPNDKYEQEADAMADKVVQRLARPEVFTKKEPVVQAKPLAGTITPLVQKKCAACEEEQKLQMKEEVDEKDLVKDKLLKKPIFESNAEPPDDEKNIQRKCAACEQEEKLQMKQMNGTPAVPTTGESIQRKCAECEQEEKLQRKKQDEDKEMGMVQRKMIFEMSLNPAGSNVQRKCAACEHEEKLQRMETHSETSASSSLESRISNSKGSGSPLNHDMNESMRGAFGSDFSGVRIHTDSSAVQMSKELNAQAFTHGSDIYFNSGKYNTSNSAGKQLLAHELTHTVQQGASKPADPASSSGINKSTEDNLVSKSGKDQIMRAYLRDSTMEICHRVLKSQTFKSTNGAVAVKFRPRLSDPDNPDCEHHQFHVSLTYSWGPFTFETDPVNFNSSKPGWVGWLFIPDGDCYLTIWREYDNPYCCLLGDVVVTDTTLVDCEEIRHNREFPSQLGGSWDWNGTGNDGTYGPGPQLDGPYPNPVYMRDPEIPSGAKCRGACGPNCDTCETIPEYTYTDPVTNETWLYTNFEICNAHEGCRQHDAAFDWAAAEKGERGRAAPVMKWHMAANYECICNYNFGQCTGWIKGHPPYTEKLYFADKAEQISSGLAQQECKEQNPDFTICTEEGADRDEVLVLWGMENGYEDFRDCGPHRHFPGGIIQACDLGPGKTWHCTATDSDTGEEVTISIFECYCCNDEGASGSDWRAPHVSIPMAFDIASSRGAPILGQDAFNKTQNHIKAGRYAAALDIVVADLVTSGRMDPSKYTIKYVNLNGHGEGLTHFPPYHVDPGTGDYIPDAPSEVEIYTPAFTSVQWLVSSVMHEYQHVLQMQRSVPPDEYHDKTGEYLQSYEVEAYLWEIEHSDETGMAAQIRNMRDTMQRLTDHYKKLGGINPKRQALYTDRYNEAREYVRDLQEAAPPMPGYSHVYHHGSDYDMVEKLRNDNIDARGRVDFGFGFYTHTKDNWRLAREWAIRHSLGKKGWGVVTFPVPDVPWNEVIKNQLVFRNTRSRPRNTPINPDTGKQFKDWKEFVEFNKKENRKGKLREWSEFDVIEGPLWGRLSKTPDIHQVMFTSTGVVVLNRSDVKPLRKMKRWLFLRYR